MFRYAYGAGYRGGTNDQRRHQALVEMNKRQVLGRHRIVSVDAEEELAPPTIQRRSRRFGNSSVSSARRSR